MPGISKNKIAKLANIKNIKTKNPETDFQTFSTQLYTPIINMSRVDFGLWELTRFMALCIILFIAYFLRFLIKKINN